MCFLSVTIIVDVNIQLKIYGCNTFVYSQEILLLKTTKAALGIKVVLSYMMEKLIL